MPAILLFWSRAERYALPRHPRLAEPTRLGARRDSSPWDSAGWGLSPGRLFRLPRVGCRSYLVISPVRLPSFGVELLERMLSVACE